MAKTEVTSVKFDLIVIGGGIFGSAVARDATLRGLKVILLEKNDFGSGFSGKNGGLLKNNLKYFEFDKKKMETHVVESIYVQNIASNLMFKIPFIFPVEKSYPNSNLFIEFVDTFFSNYDFYQQFKNSKKHLRLTKEETIKLSPGISENIVGSVTTEEFGIDPFRLNILNIISAKENGAEIMNHAEIIDIIVVDGVVKGVEVVDKIKNENFKVWGNNIFNATGGFNNIFMNKLNINFENDYSKWVYIVLDRKLSNYGVSFLNNDGKQISVIPHLNSTIIAGNTGKYYGDLSNVEITDNDIEYLLKSTEKIIPDIKKHRMIRAYAGAKINLEETFQIIDHKKENNIEGLFTLLGGTLALFRLIAQNCVDIVSKRTGNSSPCLTHAKPLPGCESVPNLKYLAKRYQIPLYIIERCFYKYGDRISNIIEMIEDKPFLKAQVCFCESVIEAEIRYVIRYEFARTIDDIKRRTRAGMGGCQGNRCNLLIAKILKDELALPVKEECFTSDFLQKRFKGMKPVLKNKYQIQQLELNLANHKFTASVEGGEFGF